MTLHELVAAVRERGPETELWVVFEEDRHESVAGKGFNLVRQRAFWKRGEAYAYAAGAHSEREWRHYYVFRIAVDAPWVSCQTPRTLEFEAAFDDAREVPPVTITGAELAAALDE